MNANNEHDPSYRSLLLLEEISKEDSLSQRVLSKRLGIAVGLVNSYLKNFIAKGYIRVSTFPKNRYKYLLTPKGIAEKTRLTYQHLHYFTSLYTTARKDFKVLFLNLEEEGVESVLFCGVDEVAEIAYLSLQETGIELVGVVDDEEYAGRLLLKYSSEKIENMKAFEYDRIIISSLKRQSDLFEKLVKSGIKEDLICYINSVT